MSLSVRSCSPGISSWAHGTRRVGLGGGGRGGRGGRRGGEEREGRGREEFSSTAYGKADWSSFTKHPFHTPESPQNLRAQESTQRSYGRQGTVTAGDMPTNIVSAAASSKITFPILEDVLLKKSQFKIVLKTYLKIGL